MTKTFSAMKDNQLRLTFPDGSLSCVWGLGTYTDNRDMMPMEKYKNNIAGHSWIGTWLKTPMESETIEVMYDCTDKDKLAKIVKKFGDENPIGHMSFKDWLWLIKLMSK